MWDFEIRWFHVDNNSMSKDPPAGTNEGGQVRDQREKVYTCGGGEGQWEEARNETGA